MKKKFTSLKTLLVAAALCVGGNAWAEITYNTTLVDQDFSNVSSESANWTTGSGMALAQTLRSGTDYYYTMSFGNSGNAASTADYAFPSLSGYDAYQLSFLWGLYSCSATNRSSLFKIVGSSGDFATTGYVAGQSSSVTLTCGETATSLDVDKYSTGTRDNANRTSTLYKITIEGIASGDDAGIYMTITSEDGSTTKLAKTKISTTYQTITKLHFECGQYYGHQAIDNVLLKAYSASDVVSSPSIAITGVSGINRTVTITSGTSSMGNDVTTYYTIDGTEPTNASSEYTNALTITSDCTVKAISYTSAGNSEVSSLTVATGAVTLASPSVSLSSYVSADANCIISPTMTIYAPNNSGVLLAPETETLEYTFTPEGGSESARTTISSGATYTPTENGTLTVYANTTGYSESSYTIPVSNFYSVSTTLDYASLYTEAQGEWTVSGNDWGYTAYNVTSSNWGNSGVTYNRLNIRNNNTVDYVVGFGFGRYSNSYSFRIRNQVKGNFFNVISSTVAAEPTTTSDVIFCTSGSGVDGDVVSTPAIAAKNVIKTIYEYEPCGVPSVSATISPVGYATFSSAYPLNLGEISGGAAYVVTSATQGYIHMEEATGVVPANTGLIIKKENGGTVTIPVSTSAATAPATNYLVAVTADNTTVTAGNYVLAAEDGVAGFYLIDETTATLNAGKAYLSSEIPVSEAKARLLFGGDDATGIMNIATKVVENGAIYNIAGQRVNVAYKGIVIKDGKKYLNK